MAWVQEFEDAVAVHLLVIVGALAMAADIVLHHAEAVLLVVVASVLHLIVEELPAGHRQSGVVDGDPRIQTKALLQENVIGVPVQVLDKICASSKLAWVGAL